MAQKYFAELERQWEQKPKKMMQRMLNPLAGTDFERAKSLRGPDFVMELTRLAVMTKDERFQDALFALVEHGIIDDEHNFLPWKGRVVDELRKKIELKVYVFIYWLRSRGASLRRACALLAVLWGWPAMSFTAAIKDLELISRRRKHLGEARGFSSDEIEFMLDLIKEFSAIEKRRCGIGRMDFSCITSIPTTAEK